LKASPASKKQRPHRQNEFSEHQNASNADALTGAGGFCKKLNKFRNLRSRQLIIRLEADPYTPGEIKQRAASKYTAYVHPDCQDSNPADPDPVVGRRGIFKELDRLLGPPLLTHFALVLADTGMGKSTFLDRYYAHHWQSSRRVKRFKISLLPLNGLDVNQLLNRVDPVDRSKTVLLLDALDEDSAAIEDFKKRIGDIMKLAGKFRSVVVTCRTQFLTNSAQFPEKLDIPAPAGPMPLIVDPDWRVSTIYLSPFSEKQVYKYLGARASCKIPALSAFKRGDSEH